MGRLHETFRRAFEDREHRRSGGIRTARPPSRAFAATFELVPGRASRSQAYDASVAFARDAARDGRLAALSITENAGGHPALSPPVLGREIRDLGMEPIIHFSCKDKNRNEIESHLFELDRYHLRNLLVVTGDYPRFGYEGQAKPVFDLDSVLALGLIEAMNRGIVLDPRAPGGGQRLPRLDFYAGAVVSPFKRLEAELVPQYAKLRRKVAAGARFIITQMGFDVRKYDEVLRFMAHEGLRVPVLATVFLPDLRLARLLNRGVVPGCVVPDAVLAAVERETGAPDGGHGARIERGARLVAILKGLGFDGVHLSGTGLTYDDVSRVLDRAAEIGDEWPDLVPEFLHPGAWDFWYFQEDPATGLNSDRPTPLRRRRLHPAAAAGFRINRLVHRLFFRAEGPLFGMLREIARRIEGSPLEGAFTRLEHWVKEGLFDCQRCGDCTLDALAFLCPQSGCAKFLLNGPCGGSRDGWCEVWPGRRRCIYVRVYQRLRSVGGVQALSAMPPLPPRDWSLYRKASWLTFFLGRDHHRAGRDADGEGGG
ncbi:methylenetetrahydrofolate reductase [Dissulfurirhabdus thermomarina]|uniref:Methylenetetrahydrofolate reductase n=1 Tax=Dissulfurirhabdus thermomarina TaxID=1765737 RepID=A0A6N9TTH6_DISTH|nr:methylenetetrahydrofolate reductase C-terminal domain-containing protein [Dissulfurirhabdus thermomarina]NDY43044.1 methylenetetrahydrofolate reductase [Dissulfurirhabdus thermomarina]